MLLVHMISVMANYQEQLHVTYNNNNKYIFNFSFWSFLPVFDRFYWRGRQDHNRMCPQSDLNPQCYGYVGSTLTIPLHLCNLLCKNANIYWCQCFKY